MVRRGRCPGDSVRLRPEHFPRVCARARRPPLGGCPHRAPRDPSRALERSPLAGGKAAEARPPTPARPPTCPLPGRALQSRAPSRGHGSRKTGEVSPHLRCGGPEVSEGRVEGTALEGFAMTNLPPGFPSWGPLDSGQGARWGRAEVETPLPSRPETKIQSLGPRLWPHLTGVFAFPFPCVCGSRVTHILLSERVKSLVPEKQTSALPGQ